MKKLIFIFIAFISFNGLYAQQGDNRGRMNDRYESNNTKYSNDRRDNGYSNDQAYGRRDNRFDDRRRQADMQRMNREYDQRINGYRNNRSMNAYERERRIRDAERERQQKAKSFGTGLVVGGIAGVLLGVLIAH